MFHVVIPARMASMRFPGKVLHPIAGKPMIEHVHANAVRSGAQTVAIATDSQDVVDAARTFGATAVMTGDHPSGSDRVAAAAASLDLPDDAIVVNVQGDEPLMPAAAIAQTAALLDDTPDASMATLATPVVGTEDFQNPNVVKVVLDDSGCALYFSRAPIPWDREAYAGGVHALSTDLTPLRHIGIYAYRLGFLKALTAAPPAALEQVESLEQLRALAMGARIRVGIYNEAIGPGVDSPEDVDKVEQFMQKKIRVLFVCMGNICRSPTAQGVAEKVAKDSGLADRFEFDSAGTHAYHVGEPPDPRATRAARERGMDLSGQRARHLTAEDFERFDYVLVMDDSNYANAVAIAGDCEPANLQRMMDYSGGKADEVPDPYYGGGDGFEHVLDLLENAMQEFLTSASRA